ncbi:MAG: preprotein translocase subunit SecE [Clostridiales bacterium]|nr:preprotein translocase subunit SecE [Clostridiales bacterium]
MWRELKKVTWPSRADLINYTLIVLAFMIFMGVVIGLLDAGASGLIAMLIG